VIRVDEGDAWKFASTGDLAFLASTAQSREIIDRMLAGKTVHVDFTPDGSEPRQLELSLGEFAAALKRARQKAE
jgi:hypothetical protein